MTKIDADRVYDYVRVFIAEHGYAPSYREIQTALGLSSTRIVGQLLADLRDAGKLDWHEGKRRTLRLL